MASQDFQNQLNELWTRAKKLRAEGKWEDAVKTYSRVIQLVPRFAPAYVERGLLAQEMGYPDMAMGDFENAIQLDPQFGYAYYGRSWVRGSKGDHAGALADAKKGMLLDPQNAGMYFRRIGAAYQGMGRLSEAIEAYNEAIRLNSDKDEGTIYNRGMCYSQMKEFALALADFNRCLELDPDWAWAFSERGKVYLYMKQFDKAIADGSSAIKYKPNYFHGYLIRAYAYQELGDHKKARADFENAFKLTGSPQLKKHIQEQLNNLKKDWWKIF
jgi:tetratricopeptide (TPR) repeat protein